MAVLKPQRSGAGEDFAAILKVVNQLAVAVNEIKADYNLLLAKLDLDAGVTDTNYASLRSITSPNADTIAPSGG